MAKKEVTLQEMVTQLLDVLVQQDLAKLANLSQPSISRVKAGTQTEVGYESGKAIRALYRRYVVKTK